MSLGKRSGLVWILLLLAILALAIWSLQRSEHPADGQTSDAAPGVELVGSRLDHYGSSGDLIWTASSKDMQYQQDSGQTVAHDVLVQFFSDSHPTLQLHADQLTFFNESGDLDLSGKVVARDSEQKLRFETEAANWNERDGVLRGDGPLAIQRNDLMLQGANFTYWPRENSLKVQSAQLRFWPNSR